MVVWKRCVLRSHNAYPAIAPVLPVPIFLASREHPHVLEFIQASTQAAGARTLGEHPRCVWAQMRGKVAEEQ